MITLQRLVFLCATTISCGIETSASSPLYLGYSYCDGSAETTHLGDVNRFVTFYVQLNQCLVNLNITHNLRNGSFLATCNHGQATLKYFKDLSCKLRSLKGARSQCIV
eukprot:m.68347 g.68347  ORF g.68347 m.68347 type:complete len:108 (+) comp11959_c0_seq1:112-435(+)